MKKSKQQKPDLTRKAALKQMKKAMRAENEYMKAQGLTLVKQPATSTYQQKIRDGAIPISAEQFEQLLSDFFNARN